VLSSEDQELERRVDLINRISTTMLKKLQACLSGGGLTMDAEKRMVGWSSTQLKVKGLKGPNIALNERTHLRAMERHLSYRITVLPATRQR